MDVKPIPDGYTAVTPYLIVGDVDKLLEFLKSAFGAHVTAVHRDGEGRVMHGDVTIGDAHIMMGQANATWGEKLGSIHLYVPDSDAAYRSAIDAGGKSIYEPTTHFYGDRSAGVEDPCGVTWWISTHVEEVSAEEMQRRMQAGHPG